MRVGISWLPSVILLFGMAAAAAPTFPCASVAPEVRDQMRESGACRDDTPAEATPKRKRSAARKAAPTKPSAQPAPSADTASPAQKPDVPDVIGPSASPAGTAGIAPVTAPTITAAASSAPPAAQAAPVPASEPAVPPASRARSPVSFTASDALLIGAGLSFGLVSGALLMRQWLLRRVPTAGAEAARPVDAVAAPPSRDPPPIEGAPSGGAEPVAAPEIRFAARREAGETTIVFAPRPNGDEVAVEYSGDRHA